MKTINNKILYLSNLSDCEDSWGFSYPEKLDTYTILENKNKLAVVVKNTFYKTHKLFFNNLLSKMVQIENPKTIVIHNDDFVKTAMTSTKNCNSIKTYYFTKNVLINKHLSKNLNLHTNAKYIFENDIDLSVATNLSQNNIKFETTKKYENITSKQIKADTPLYSFSDFYYTKKIDLEDLTPAAILSLDKLFNVATNLNQINFNSKKLNLNAIEKVITSYIKNNLKLSFATFTISLNSLALKPEEYTKLEILNTILFKNKCKLNICLYQKETAPYSDFIEIIKPLKSFADKVKDMQLSNLEKIILLYDEAKSKTYNDNKEYKRLSRYLLSSLKTDYVVCHAFADRLKALCDMSYIPATTAKCRLKMYNGHYSEHTKVITYLKDKKYDFNDILIMEPTYDNKEDKNKLDAEKDLDNYLYFLNDFVSSKQLIATKQAEFGLLKTAEKNTIDIGQVEHNNESARQINELFNTNISAYKENKINPDFVNKVKDAIDIINNSEPIEIGVFASALKTARSKIDPTFDDEDINRILNINFYKAETAYLKKSKNMFNKVDKEEDNLIFSFEEELD